MCSDKEQRNRICKKYPRCPELSPSAREGCTHPVFISPFSWLHHKKETRGLSNSQVRDLQAFAIFAKTSVLKVRFCAHSSKLTQGPEKSASHSGRGACYAPALRNHPLFHDTTTSTLTDSLLVQLVLLHKTMRDQEKVSVSSSSGYLRGPRSGLCPWELTTLARKVGEPK